MDSRQADPADPIHLKLKAAIEVPTRMCLWTEADTIEFTPPVASTIYGDGRALFRITTCNDRPAYWVIRGDSSWSTANSEAPDDAPEFIEAVDDILCDLEGEFGRGRCSYQGSSLRFPIEERTCTCEECADPEIVEFPSIDDDGGCMWSRLEWPDGFETIPHPFDGSVTILAAADTVAARFRERYRKPSSGGVKASAPMREDVATLNAALAKWGAK